MFLLCWGGQCGRWNWGGTVSPNSGLKHIMLAGVSWLSLDLHTDLSSMLGCDWSRLNLWLIFPVFLFSSQSSSPYSPRPSHVKTCPLHTHTHSLFSNVRIMCAGCVQTSGRQHLQDMTYIKVCVRFMTGPELSALYTSTLYFCKYTHFHTFMLFYVLSCCSHWAQDGKIIPFVLKLRWQSRFLFKMGGGCYSSGFS